MKHGWPLAGSLVCLTALVTSCSDTSSSKDPAAQAGDAGSSTVGGGSGSGNSSGQAGALGHSGSMQAAGSAGRSSGGSSSAGTAGTSTDTGGASAGQGGSAENPSGPYHAVHGTLCPVDDTLGVVEILRGSPSTVQVSLYDQPTPWITTADLTTATCEYHLFRPFGCSACPTGLVCSVMDGCVPEPRTIKDATLQVSVGAEKREYLADPMLGGISSKLDIGDQDSSFAMTLSWGDTQITLDPMPVATGQLEELKLKTENRNEDPPGPLDATWQPPGDEAFVHTRIPINHHGGGPTFTECRAPSSSGGFHADAEMMDPLAVETGIELQGVFHSFIAAAVTPQGCVEFRFGKRLSVILNDLDF